MLMASSRYTRLVQAHFDQLDEPLTLRQFRLLVRIANGSESPGELGRLMRLTAPTVSESVDTLVRRGLVARHASMEDRRRQVLVLTAKGNRALEQGIQLANELEMQMQARLPTALRPHARAMYEAMACLALDELHAVLPDPRSTAEPAGAD